VTSVIIGARTNDQLVDNLAAADLVLTAAELAALDSVSALPPEYPGWMLERQGSDRAAVIK
jgi:aryl-alcohol dehydrogenase-like predicted oxidoreductase